MAHIINLRDKQPRVASQSPEEPVQPRDLPPEPVIQHPIVPYVIAALLGAGAILIGFFQRDVTTAILFGFLAIMTVVHVRRPVPLVEIELSPLNIKISDQTYRYEEIKSFWVHYEPEYDIRELSLH